MIVLFIGLIIRILFMCVLKKCPKTKWVKKAIIPFDILLSLYIAISLKENLIQYWYGYFFVIPISYIMYILSCLIVGRKLSGYNLLFNSLFPLSKQIKKRYKHEVILNLYNASIEEIVYRGGFYYLIYYFSNSLLLTFLLVTIIFAFSHDVKRMYMVQRIDIIIFSFMITLVYSLCSNLMVVILIHILRNQFVIMQKYNDINRNLKRSEELAYIFNAMKGKSQESNDEKN